MSNVRENLPQAITGAITEVREKERKEGGRERESINNIIIVFIIITVLGCILVSCLILLDILFCS